MSRLQRRLIGAQSFVDLCAFVSYIQNDLQAPLTSKQAGPDIRTIAIAARPEAVESAKMVDRSELRTFEQCLPW